MCQKKPGNRCSAHAKRALQSAENVVQNLANSKDTKSPAFREALSKRAEARFEYHTTPEGQKELEGWVNREMKGNNHVSARVLFGELQRAKEVRERRSEGLKAVQEIERQVEEKVLSKKTRDYNRGVKHGFTGSHVGGSIGYEDGPDSGYQQRTYQRVEAKRELLSLEVKHLRDEISTKVDKGTVGRRDYARLSKALVKQGRFMNYADGSRSETASFAPANTR